MRHFDSSWMSLPCLRGKLTLDSSCIGKHPFIIISWLTSLGAIGNLILGTLTLSGLQYISVRDAMIAIARYFASAIACRVVLNVEAAGMRANVDITDSNRFRQPTMPRLNTMDSNVADSSPGKTPLDLTSGANRVWG